MTNYRKCLICSESIEPIMSFGKMPIANGFLTKEQFSKEYFFEMQVAHCPKCGMFQLTEQPEREKMFNENYAFFSGTSKLMAIHFKEFAEHVIKDYIASKDPFVVEIGSNDGIMLQNFASKKIRHLGIEPSANVAKVAQDKGINTISKFFDEELARAIVKEYGQADAFLAANVMCHIPYMHSIVEGIRILLKPDGIVMFEDPYLGDVIENTTYDQIYDEHVFLFSVSSIKYLFEQHGMEVIDVEPQETHGGSMRYVIAHKGARSISKKVIQQLEKEKKLRLQKSDTYNTFRKNCEQSRDSLMSLLNKIKKQGKRIVGYAATSKSTTIINYCGITTEQIDFICDTTPIKQGKYSPGAHIPVRPYEEFPKNYPEYALLFGYNHAKEIMAKEKYFIKSGGKWIVYVPKVQVLK
ncbi:MAG: class I SAM-dependent methyltransferase [Elusimicrobiota bacterium]